MSATADPPVSSGSVVGESIPMAMVCGLIAGLIFAVIMMICHISVTKCLVAARLKHLPRLRKVKVKKEKKGKKKGKKGKKGSDTTGGGTSTSGTTAAGTTATSTVA